MENKLTQARNKISEIDVKMAELFEERMRASEDVAEYKRKCGLPIEDPQREAELIRRNSLYVSKELRPYYTSFQQDVMKASKAYQRRLISGEKIAYCGEEGAFAFFTAKKLFPDGIPVAKNSFEEAYAAVTSGECELAVIPLENSYAGEVGQVTDMLFSGPLFINAVYDIAVEQTLMGVKGGTISDIKKVISHPQALAQCAKFISSHGWETEPAQSTSSAALEISKKGDKSLAAIGCAQAAELYGLSVLEKNINESRANTTRFGIFSGTENTSAGRLESDGFALVFTVKNEAGALADALGVIGKAGFNMRTLRSRPRKELIWNYYFYLEAEGALRSEAGEKMLSELRMYCDRLKVVGIYR
ncbi:MAG: prephenate dehydratase domain-containing protein [Eubacteriales bacterium]|nr:chorismate mutase [Eubacterium sp.]MDD7180421.1 prephenate dehydratase domain-containing protein [Eubacterium sp.]MDY5493199.1 prephenate dehydratase domain-containing protein [Eubacteriales bacterium]